MTYRLKTMGLGSLPWQIKTHYFLTIYLPFSKNLLLCKPQQPNIFPLHYTYTIKNDCNSSIWIQVFWKRDGPAYSKRLSLGSVAERQQQNFLLFQSCLLHVQNINLNSKRNTQRESKKGRIKREKDNNLFSYMKGHLLFYNSDNPHFSGHSLCQLDVCIHMHIYSFLKYALKTKCIICDHGNMHI